jgi:hypothetical protein
MAVTQHEIACRGRYPRCRSLMSGLMSNKKDNVINLFRKKSMTKGIIFILSGTIMLYYCLKELFLLNGVDLTQLMTRFLIWIK